MDSPTIDCGGGPRRQTARGLVLRVSSHSAPDAGGWARASPPVTEQDFAEAESALGFAIPPVMRGLYRQVANGGFGPEYPLFPLTGKGRRAVAEYGPLRTTTSEYRPHGVLSILD